MRKSARTSFRMGAAALLLLLAGMNSVHAVTLSISNAENVRAGDAGVELTMALSNNGAAASVGGVQMDVSFDAATLTLTTVQPGASAQEAGKNVSFNELSQGVVRIIVAGLNQKTIQDGALAALAFDIAANAPAGSCPVAMTVAQMVSPNGVQITGSTVPGSVTIVSDTEGETAAEGEGEGEGEGETGTPSGCACATVTPSQHPGNVGGGLLVVGSFMLICIGLSRSERRQIPRQ